MTVLINIGRRVPRSWFRRQGSIVAGFVSFQENLWIIVKQSMSMAKKKANASGKIKFIMTHDIEDEDINYQIQWIKIIIQGTKEQEKEEHDEAMQMYQPLNKIFKKEMPKDDRMYKHFKTKILSTSKVDDAYQKGYGAINDNNLSNKMLEMGILTHVELVDDYDSREIDIVPNF